jgi:hypothetical protein
VENSEIKDDGVTRFQIPREKVIGRRVGIDIGDRFHPAIVGIEGITIQKDARMEQLPPEVGATHKANGHVTGRSV